MADFLVLNHADHKTTFYRDIFRVLPAHLMTVTADGAMAERRYWSPADIRPIRHDLRSGLRGWPARVS